MNLDWWKRLVHVSGWVILLSLTGCGAENPADSNQTKKENSDSQPTVTPPPKSDVTDSYRSDTANQSENGVTRQPDEVWEDAHGRRYLGKVPYDVFFDHPLVIASDSQSADSTGVSLSDPDPIDKSITAVPDSETGKTPSAETSLTVDWASILSAGILESEVKSIRNFLNQKLQSVGNYNSAVTMIPPRAATLAVMAGIAMEHTGDVSWKEDAGYIRDLAAGMNESPLQRGSRDQRRLRRHFENLADTLDRSRPSGLPEPDPEVSLSDVAEMRMVMLRMNQAQQRLRTEVSESSFGARRDLVVHEAAILSGLIRTVTTESYGFADDSEFTEYAAQIADSGQAIRDAAEAGDFRTFELSLSRIAGVCQACHRDYKNN
ncbi:MAG: cytochrome c [Fuerstiella sp.]|nr:cytochrome c [Fuerstiella sp.]